MSEMPKRYDPKVIEPKWQEFWDQEGIHRFDPDSDKPVYSIDTPPPTVSGSLHIGHVFSYTHTEIQARFWRMRGFNVYYPMGFDDNGLPSERLTENELGIRAVDMPRSEFIQHCLKVTRKYEDEFERLWKSMGMSIDWSLTYTTIEERTRRISQRSFLDLVKKGRAYRTTEPVMWCAHPQCRTAIAQAEVQSESLASAFSDIVFKLDDGEPLVIATTRPELLPACVAVFVHPADEKRRHLIGHKAKTPVFDVWVPIMEDENVDMEKGTGVVMCCTFGDRQDIEWWKTKGLDLRIAINPDGTMNELAGPYGGLSIAEARKKILKAIEDEGHLVGSEKIVHDVNTHERCATELEFLSSPQWFIRVMDIKDELIARADQIRWFPDFMKARYVNWVENLAWDWCISRQRYYGVPLPVWYCRACGEVKYADDAQLPVDPLADRPASPCGCGSTEFEPEADVMDTWATSSLTPNINLRWREPDEKPGIYPMSLRPQAHEIIRTWLFYTVVKSHLHDDTVPWRDVTISGFITIPRSAEEKGKGRGFKAEKISKSKHGHLTSPFKMLDDYGADCLRYWASNAPLGSDMPLQLEDFKLGKRTLTKIWNAFRFITPHLADFTPDDVPPLEVMDLWLFSRLNDTIERATAYFEQYDFRNARLEIGEMFWSAFCDNYLEFIKDRVYNPEVRGAEARRAAQHTLYHAGLAILTMYAPYVPHIVEEIYQSLYCDKEGVKSIHLLPWPEPLDLPGDVAFARRAGSAAVGVITAVRKFKSERKVSMRTPVPAVEISAHPARHKLIEAALADLKAVGNIEHVHFVESERKDEVTVSLPGTDFQPVTFPVE